jgi:hypothetical protein
MSYGRLRPSNFDATCSTSNGTGIDCGRCLFQRVPCPCRTWSGNFACRGGGWTADRSRSVHMRWRSHPIVTPSSTAGRSKPTCATVCMIYRAKRWVALDGNHRLLKATLLGVHEVGVRKVPCSLYEAIRVDRLEAL